MEVERVVSYLEKRDLNILLVGKFGFLTTKGWIKVNDYKKLSDFDFLLDDIQ